jgi:hypothetical protein
MIKKTTLLFLITTNLVSAQVWQWGISNGSYNEETTLSLCTDVFGNIYTSGYFGYGPTSTNYGVFAGDTLYVAGISDIFVASFNQSGNDRWGKKAGGGSLNSFEYGSLISLKGDSSLILYGVYKDMLMIDTFTLAGNQSNFDFFISKINYGGKCVWAKKADSLIAGGGIYTMDSDLSGRPYLVGSTSGALLDTFNLPIGIFAARIDSDGDFIWAKKISQRSQSSDWQIQATSSGFLATSVFVDTIIIDTITVMSQGGTDIIIASFDSLGSVQWVKTFGGPNFQHKAKLSLDIGGNIYISGYFNDSIYFNSTLLVNSGKDAFLAKFDPLGNFLWAQQLHSTGDTEINDLNSDDEGNVYITGKFRQSASFGSYTVSSPNYPSMFLARYDSSGNCFGVRHSGRAEGTNVISNQGSVIVSGMFYNSVNLDNTTLTSNGLTDMFIAKHDAFTGIGEFSRERNSGLFIYANPNQGKCTITIPEEFQNDQNLRLSIYDRSGKLIANYELEVSDGKLKLNLEAEPKGVYIVKLSNGIKQYSGRIVFE